MLRYLLSLGLGSNNHRYRRLLDMGAMFMCVFEQRACLIVTFSIERSRVASHEVGLSRLSIGRSSPTLELRC